MKKKKLDKSVILVLVLLGFSSSLNPRGLARLFVVLIINIVRLLLLPCGRRYI